MAKGTHKRNTLEIYMDVLNKVSQYPQGLAPSRLQALSNIPSGGKYLNVKRMLLKLEKSGLLTHTQVSKHRVCYHVTSAGYTWLRNAEAVLAPLRASADEKT